MTKSTAQQCNYLTEWRPGQEICIVLSDESAKLDESDTHRPRTPEEINEVMEIIKCAARNAGFDLSVWGLRPAFEKHVEKKFVRSKIQEAVKARDLQLAQMYPECEFLKHSPPALPEVSHLDKN